MHENNNGPMTTAPAEPTKPPAQPTMSRAEVVERFVDRIRRGVDLPKSEKDWLFRWGPVCHTVPWADCQKMLTEAHEIFEAQQEKKAAEKMVKDKARFQSRFQNK